MELPEFYRNYKKISESQLKEYLSKNPKSHRSDNPAVFKHGTEPKDGRFTYCELQDNGILKVGSMHGKLHFDHSYGFWVRNDMISFSDAMNSQNIVNLQI